MTKGQTYSVCKQLYGRLCHFVKPLFCFRLLWLFGIFSTILLLFARILQIPLFWAGFLLIVIIYRFGIIMGKSSSQALRYPAQTADKAAHKAHEKVEPPIMQHYGAAAISNCITV